jgi:superfamily I DNA and/or RNA helicase
MYIGYNISNPSEADVVVKIAEYLKNIKNVNLKSQVCVLTFYNGQVYCIKQAILKNKEIKNDGLRVMTVDSFQGRLYVYTYVYMNI